MQYNEFKFLINREKIIIQIKKYILSLKDLVTLSSDKKNDLNIIGSNNNNNLYYLFLLPLYFVQ